MRKIFFLLLFVIKVSVFAQVKKGEFYLTPDSDAHDLYVVFSASVDFNGVISSSNAISSIPELESIFDQFNVQLEKGVLLSDEKINQMAQEAIMISKSDINVKKLKNIAKVKIDNPTNERLFYLASLLESFKEVEFCSLISLRPIIPPFIPPSDLPPVTPDYEPAQNYIGANPGVNMSYAWGLGLNGAGIRIRDVEYGFNINHEDLAGKSVSVAPGMTISSSASTSYTEHGTAVFGVLYADKGGYGVSGMVYGAQELMLFPEWQQTGYDRANAVTKAIENSTAGDVIIYEMQTGGNGGNYVPAEYNSLIWTLTKAATDSGIVIVAAAGNGNNSVGEDLDSAFYVSYMSRGNSGAIIVGAGTPSTAHNKMGFSTYGSRVDVQAWGSNVRTTGYGNYSQIGGDFNQNYTNFSGTSSATPIVTACVVALQSYYYAQSGNYMTPSEMRQLLIDTGIAQGTGGHIGPIPNMQAAIESINATLGVAENNQILFSVYPNPARDKVTLNLFEDFNKKSVEIYSVLGQKISVKSFDGQSTDLDVSSLEKGVYFLKVKSGSKETTKKFIKE
ncbi:MULTISPECIES: S8/S53 family peptidase [Flavobacterium]|uniref:T9SS type A sorting domain-containing protein n=1 Tax=Flavobacterium hankyongi TaxID=1176532 RepID=A0ABP9A5Y6_9FLAO|nr:S8/S53 family peptidase [Flavobacterium sp. N1846]